MSDCTISYVHIDRPLPIVSHCPMCKGSGVEESYALVKPSCPWCGGTGHVVSWPITVSITTTANASEADDE